MKRRNFIKTAGLLSGTCLLPNFLLGACSSSGQSLPSFGVITGNTGGKWLEADPKKALKEISAWGYTDLEFGNTFGMDTESLTSFLKDVNLKPLIGPTDMAAMNDTERLTSNIKSCLELNKEYIVCYWPWTDNGQNKKADDWKQVADNLNKGGEICRKEGLKLLYHNHDLEFYPAEGQMPFDILVPALNPEYVNIELDLYWITKGNQSAIEYIKKYPGRYPVFHVKDMDHTPDRNFEYVGKGIIDFPSIFKLNDIAGVKHFIVEHDNPADPEECIKVAATFLKSLKF
ncbi:MAG: sugar phosphate isomerase/epimerase [Tannerellaceae bacterium]|jgi:sugar phosphate isomerase/epimerase|nr:sugar phosphate isomerase/epimerase [Tannerellaceae bacterium]